MATSSNLIFKKKRKHS